MILQERIRLMVWLGDYLRQNSPGWQEAKHRAERENGWFIPEFIDLATQNIVEKFLDEDELNSWVKNYEIRGESSGLTVGLVMAGNIPLVGFHDMLCAFIAGHNQKIKLSTRDTALMMHIITTLHEEAPETQTLVQVADRLKDCDAYIATGSTNTSRYFEYYFAKYPHIIRRNRTSAAVLSGHESLEDLLHLSDDINQYFGLGCRNITKLYVPEEYDFIPLIRSFAKYKFLSENHKYNNNYDYQLSILLLNSQMYMSSGALLLAENENVFSPISVVYYQYYNNENELMNSLTKNEDLQLVAASPAQFGKAQQPSLTEYADSVDTMAFLTTEMHLRKSL
ncbi:MAG: acyl-CoA reductase [Ferruginibacter sp.]